MRINRTVWILSFVSMFADIASEMLYPVIPVYLKEIGFSILLIGILEGTAEFIVGLSKGYFGKLSDQKGVRLPFVKLGYLLSAVSKPMMAFLQFPIWIFLARTTDRLGKGIRTAARDALLSQQATRETKARIFGFHRAWDTVGAITGPLIALLLLSIFPSGYETVFYLAFIPGIISVALIFLLKEQKLTGTPVAKGGFFSFFQYWKIATPAYKKLVIALCIFAIANSSDVFLLLKVREITGSDQVTIAAYIFYNIIYAMSSYPAGHLSDRFGIRKIFTGGLVLFAITYGGFAFNSSWTGVFILLCVYGLYAACTEGIAKAWITNLAHDSHTATAIGLLTSCQSICTLLASILAGVIWELTGSMYVFLYSAIISLLVAVYISRMVKAEH